MLCDAVQPSNQTVNFVESFCHEGSREPGGDWFVERLLRDEVKHVSVCAEPSLDRRRKTPQKIKQSRLEQIHPNNIHEKHTSPPGLPAHG